MNSTQIVGLTYGCEVDPTLAVLRGVFPSTEFMVERQPAGTVGATYVISATTRSTVERDSMRLVACAFRDGFAEGYDLASREAAYAR